MRLFPLTTLLTYIKHVMSSVEFKSARYLLDTVPLYNIKFRCKIVVEVHANLSAFVVDFDIIGYRENSTAYNTNETLRWY